MPDEKRNHVVGQKKEYWKRRQDLIYYQYVQALVSYLAANAESIIDIGSSDTPLLETLDWIPRRFAFDKRRPYHSENVTGIKGDFFKYEPEEKYDFALCLQVLEHVEDARTFARKLFEIANHVVISVPYKWPADSSRYHIHDPVDLEKLKVWTGREPGYFIIISEPRSKRTRLICYYHPEGKKVDLDYVFARLSPADKKTEPSRIRRIKKIIRSRLWGKAYKLTKRTLSFGRSLWIWGRDLLKEPRQLVIPWIRKERSYIRRARKAVQHNDWMEAVNNWHKALMCRPAGEKSSGYIHRELARAYMRLKEPEQVEEHMKTYLELSLGLQLEEVMQGIRNKLYPEMGSVDSMYKYLGGRGNYGFIEHWSVGSAAAEDNRGYLTKIARAGSTGVQKEKHFYLQICERFPVLKELTTPLVDITEIKAEDLTFLTLRKIEGIVPKSKEYLGGITRAQEILAAIKYAELKEYLGEDDLNPGFLLDQLMVPVGKRTRYTFASIHQHITNQKVINWLYRKAALQEVPGELEALIGRLKNLILDRQLYTRLDPEVNYCLAHGDFGRYNLLADSAGRVYVLDWSSYLAAPRGYDMAYYFRKIKWKWRKIEKEFLACPERSGYLTPLEIIFFIYTLIVLRFVDDVTDTAFKEDYCKFLEPAVDYLERLAAEQFQ